MRKQGGSETDSIQIVRSLDGRSRPGFALFDFDGTLSLIREGWQQIMIPMFVNEILATGTTENREFLEGYVGRFVAELTGKQTIYQMMRLRDEVALRGGTPQEPLDYKREYHERLMNRIVGRRQDLQSGAAAAADWVVPGTFDMLELLNQAGIQMFLASGTDLHYVLEELELLELTKYFEGRVFGALDDHEQFSKQQVIDAILTEHSIPGAQLVGFGDGYVEIENVSRAGGLAVAVATDEVSRSGKCDPWKKKRLIEVGADIVVPDFSEAQILFDFIWNE